MRNEKKKEGNGHDDNCGIGSHVFAVSNFKRGGVKQKKKTDCTHVSVADLYTRIHPSQLVFFYRLHASLLAGPAVACALGCVRERVHPSTFHLFTGVQDMWQRGCHRATGCSRSRSNYYKTLVRLLLLLLPVEEN